MTPDAPPPATQAGTAPAARHSLESRLHVRLLLVLGMLWLVAAAVAIFEVRKETNEVLDLALAENAERLLTLLPLHLPEDPLDADRARYEAQKAEAKAPTAASPMAGSTVWSSENDGPNSGVVSLRPDWAYCLTKLMPMPPG